MEKTRYDLNLNPKSMSLLLLSKSFLDVVLDLGPSCSYDGAPRKDASKGMFFLVYVLWLFVVFLMWLMI